MLYTAASGGAVSQLAKVEVKSRAHGATTGPTLAQEIRRFDGFGRLRREERQLPSGAFSIRETLYDAQHQRLSVSEAHTSDLGKRTEFLSYDPFGRPQRIRPADGASHDVVLEYDGVRVVRRKVKVATIELEGQPPGESETFRAPFRNCNLGASVRARDVDDNINRMLASPEWVYPITPAAPGNPLVAFH